MCNRDDSPSDEPRQDPRPCAHAGEEVPLYGAVRLTPEMLMAAKAAGWVSEHSRPTPTLRHEIVQLQPLPMPKGVFYLDYRYGDPLNEKP